MLVNCVAYEDGRKLADIDKHEISNYLARPGCFVWVALRDPDPGRARRDAGGVRPAPARGRGRPRTATSGRRSRSTAIRCSWCCTPSRSRATSCKIGEVNVFVARNYVLSVRNRTERGFQDVRARAEREPELLKNGSGYVLYALMDAIVDRYFPVLDAIEMELEKLEERLFAPGASPRENIESLYYVKQKLTT